MEGGGGGGGVMMSLMSCWLPWKPFYGGAGFQCFVECVVCVRVVGRPDIITWFSGKLLSRPACYCAEAARAISVYFCLMRESVFMNSCEESLLIKSGLIFLRQPPFFFTQLCFLQTVERYIQQHGPPFISAACGALRRTPAPTHR